MAKSLVIVESNAKSKTINRFLGKEYIVKASIGHIKNLPKNRLGVDIDNGYEPEYITIRGRGDILKDLKKTAAAADKVLIATDPDREGEAIAYHLANEITPANPEIRRVLFHEITEHAIRDAVQKPLDLNTKMVEAQVARRVMDRLVGYKVSPFLWKTVYRGLSAGRVQSVALRLICEREEEISAFKPEEYWTLDADMQSPGSERFRSRLVKIKGEKPELPDEATVKEHIRQISGQQFHVSDLTKKTISRKPYPPYTTSTLQQDGARRLGMTTKRIMSIAQDLYEGIDLPEGRVGLITYMRTDSTRLASSAVQEARETVAEMWGLEYVPAKPRMYRSKKSAQDAHEAIRPTSAARSPKAVAPYLTPQQAKLYELIWSRFMASQMADAKIAQSSLDVSGGDYTFRTTGSVVVFRGFMQAYQVEKEESEKTLFPEGVKKDDSVAIRELDPQQHFTKPPARYNESSLVKVLDELGIGRPSTYALIISTLLQRKYVDKDARSLVATDLGMAVNAILVKQFPDIFSVGFTAEMETELDQIESGEKDRVQVLDDFYHPFHRALEEAMESKDEIKESLQENTNETCPKCGRDLVVKWGRNGKFIACTGYPDCKHTQPLNEDTPDTDEICDRCGSPMIVKNGRFGRFLACSKYPDCRFTKSFSTGVACPEEGCSGTIVERKSRKGKLFYGCSNYPECKFATWAKPVPKKCAICGNAYHELRSSKAQGEYYQCPGCKNTIPAESE
ncbi:type I DNA topoisomerase [bacterium]|nr:type I DNA topoisomerase [bacterium]